MKTRLSITLLLLLALAPAAEEKRLTIYAPGVTYSIPVDSRDYVDLVACLDPLGKVTARLDGNRYRVRFETANTQADAEFTAGKDSAKIRGRKVPLGHKFAIENIRGYLPVASLAAVLSPILNLNVQVHEAARRVFIAGTGTTFSFDFQKSAPPRLVLRFTNPVSPSIANEPGHMRLTFSRDAVLGTSPTNVSFDDKTLPSAAFTESNGSAELTINTTAPLMATFSDGNKTITIAPVVTQAATPPTVSPKTAAQQPAQPAAPAASTAVTPQAQPAAPGAPAPPRYLVLIDPSHGGDDRGETLSPALYEKDVTLAFAQRLRTELANRGITAILLRDADTYLAPDQRAANANSSHAVLYLSIHVASQGTGVRLYTARIANAVAGHPAFLPWNSAQSAFADPSRGLLAAVTHELETRQVSASPLSASLRPLASIAKPAIAIEIAPPQAGIEGLNSSVYQQTVTAGIAAGIADYRGATEPAR